jgi:hypothetical protein
MDMHVNHILSVANQWLILVNLFRNEVCLAMTHEISFQTLIISRLIYATPAFAFFYPVLFWHITRFIARFANLLKWVSLAEFFILQLSYLMLNYDCCL